MNKKHHGAIALPFLVCSMIAIPAMAQDEAKDVYAYVTYHVCDVNKQDRADEIFEELNKPILDAAVADGSIMAYGYNAHHTGGRWRRGQFFLAPTVDGLLEAQKKQGDAADAKNKKLSDEYGSICNAHDDYIWRRAAGSVGSVPSGGYAFSTYYVCDSREDQADAIAAQVFAPLLDKLVAEGKLKSWGWLEHIVGGSFRRLATMGAADLKSLMAARGELVAAVDGNALADQFTNICDSHADYIWESKFAKP